VDDETFAAPRQTIYVKSIFALAVLFVPVFVTAQAPTPQQVADELLEADRAFSAASAKSDLITGLSAMFAADVAMPAPTGIVYGAEKAIAALRANPANAGAKAEWTPARVGLSADGRHGFTAGFMTVTRADGTVQHAKYMAYWEKQSAGWRALAYKRAPAQVAAPKIAVGRVLPEKITAAPADDAAIERNRESLAEAERSFSRDAQTMGIGAAFTLYGSPDAANFGGPDVPTFVFGNVAIGAAVGAGSPPNTSPVNWGPEKTIIARSGDFGVTIGYIVRNAPGAEGSGQGGKIPAGQPFFTIWRRDASGAWRYIAE
jgi:ketosteroid isomerase-like protein